MLSRFSVANQSMSVLTHLFCSSIYCTFMSGKNCVEILLIYNQRQNPSDTSPNYNTSLPPFFNVELHKYSCLHCTFFCYLHIVVVHQHRKGEGLKPVYLCNLVGNIFFKVSEQVLSLIVLLLQMHLLH